MFRTQKVLALALLLSFGAAVQAASVTYTPAPTTQAGWSPCGSFPGYSCMTTAYFDAYSLDTQNDGSISALFQYAWDAGNNGGYTLSSGGALSGDFSVTTATANQFSGVTLGGLTINIDVSGITLPTLGTGDDLVWVQGLYINYTVPAGTIVSPYSVMDTSTLSSLVCGGTIFCPPAYPYQYTDNSFYDQPKDFYMPPGTTQAFFDANAYLAVRNIDAKTITVYDGVSYGFQNYVSPEPAAWLLFVAGFGVLLLIRRKRQAA